MKKLLICLSLSVCVLFSSCITTLSPGVFYNSTSEHVYKDRAISQLGSGRILKMAKSCTYNSIFLAPFYHGKHTEAAVVAKEAGITNIGVIDYSSFSFLSVLYYSNCIIVWGDTE